MKQLQISDAEWEILKVIWDISPATVNDISDMLVESKQWHPKTVRTMLNRMVNKGVLDKTNEQGMYQYFPLHDKEELIKQASESFLERVFNGALTPMVAHLVKQRPLTSQERKELLDILNDED
ncbi:MAG: hypothetical protein COA96_06995 [SAR86 cluster bacterium]|uniref:BlaI/MecI/CopY family transcriptional regulator n=1 Tax=SAR86 cluster bacterium TaxID=2030880 RepID=A0A2A5B238_9GAMM|nr:MAG: hypothetical protein COA96_06995 [SAR86 cluster bacterium]